MFFDPETMDAQINNPGWVKGLEEYIRASELAPPNALNFSFGEVNAAFAGGQVAQSIGWGDTGVIAADPGQSVVAGNVGSGMLPGSAEIWNYTTASGHVRRDRRDSLHGVRRLAGGGARGIEEPEAAWHFISVLTSPEVSSRAAVTGGTGVNPYRSVHTENLELWADLFSEREAREYLGAQAASVSAPNVALDMRLPGYFSYTEILEIELSRALAGQVSPQEALDIVAAGWNELTDEFGRDLQLAAYRASMGLPPL
jgi:multiple sugar transport system substrate-binding protein